MFCVATPFHPPSKEKGRTGGRNHSSRPASTASLSTGEGMSCGPLVCLCYTRVAMHARSFPSTRVIVVVLPLPSLLDVFPSVEPTTIVNICIQLAGFEQNRYFEGKCIALLYILRIVMLLLLSATLGRGFHWRDTRAAAPAAASRLLSYCQNPGAPLPSRLAGTLTHAVSGDRDSQW